MMNKALILFGSRINVLVCQLFELQHRIGDLGY